MNLSSDKIIFYPLSALHVVVTDIIYTQWRRLISIWKKNQINEKCKIKFLKLKCECNLDDIEYSKNILRKMTLPNSNLAYMVDELIRFYEIQIEIERKNRYYRCIHSSE